MFSLLISFSINFSSKKFLVDLFKPLLIKDNCKILKVYFELKLKAEVKMVVTELMLTAVPNFKMRKKLDHKNFGGETSHEPTISKNIFHFRYTFHLKSQPIF